MSTMTKRLVLILIAALVLGVAACARQAPAAASQTPAVSPDAAVSSSVGQADPSPSAVIIDITVPSAPAPVSPAVASEGITMEDVKTFLNSAYQGAEVEILGTTPVNAEVQLVEFNVKTMTNSFLLCDMSAGIIENLPVADVVLKKVINENYFVFEDRGEYTDSAFRFFPGIIRCFRIATDNKNQNFTTVTEDELFDLSRSVKAGCKPGSVLASLEVTFNGFEVLFKPVPTQEGRAMFYADATSIPPTKTSYDTAKNQFTVELETGNLGNGIKSGVTVKTDENQYMSSYTIVQKDGKTYIVAQLNDFAQQYMIKENTGPDAFAEGVDGSFPYLIVTFSKEPDIPLDY